MIVSFKFLYLLGKSKGINECESEELAKIYVSRELKKLIIPRALELQVPGWGSWLSFGTVANLFA